MWQCVLRSTYERSPLCAMNSPESLSNRHFSKCCQGREWNLLQGCHRDRKVEVKSTHYSYLLQLAVEEEFWVKVKLRE